MRNGQSCDIVHCCISDC